MNRALSVLGAPGDGSESRRKFGFGRWHAVATRRGARTHLLAIGALVVVLAGVLALCLRPADTRPPIALKPEIMDAFAARHLPGAPDADPGEFTQVAAPVLGKAAALRNANVPMVALGPSALPFRFSGTLPDRMRARACLAAAMLFEAGDDGAGQLAVGQVVLNRVRHPAFPKTVCGVVLQGSERATGCQFTFTCDGALARHTSSDSRTRALVRADMMLTGLTYGAVGLATHYHTVDVYPWWSPKLEKIARQGAHLFFRWPGYWGSAAVAAIGNRGSEPSAMLFASFDPLLESSKVAGAEGTASIVAQEETIARLATPEAMQAAEQRDVARAVAAIPVPLSRRLAAVPNNAVQSSTVVIAPSALEGNRLLRMFPGEGVFFLQVTRESSDASRRRVAGLLCGGRADCRVYGWQDASLAPATSDLDPRATANLAFRFVRKPAADARAVPVSANAF